LVMRYFPQKSLDHLLSQRQVKVHWSLRWRFALEMARGINCLHQRQPPILHRDVKSLNLLLDEDFHLFVADFGLARIKPLNPVTAVGTEQCNAPELLTGERVAYTEKCDVYSFGLVLYEVATRRKPFGQASVELFVEMIKDGKRPPIIGQPSGSFNGEREQVIPQEFAQLVERCWAQDPSERPTFPEIIKTILVSFKEGDNVTLPYREPDAGQPQPKAGQPQPKADPPNRDSKASVDRENKNKDVKDWDEADVGQWLTKNNFGEYQNRFAQAKVTGSVLVKLTDEELKELGITDKFHIKSFRSREQF